ncbi:MAG: ABC transporter permease [Actinomycetota bacterium]
MSTRLLSLGLRITPIALAFAIAAAVFALAGFDVIEILGGTVEGSITGRGSAANTLRWSIPLILIGVGVAVSLRTGEFNIGGQGQFLMGQCAAVWVGLQLDMAMPWLFVVATLLAVLAGAVWSAIAGVLKVAFGADEVITTLMLNFVALQFVQWVTTGALADPLTSGDAASTARLAPEVRLQGSGEISVVLVTLTVVVAALVLVLVERTSLGVGFKIVGANPTAAAWQGLPVTRIRLASYAVSGGLAGLAGAAEVFGPAGRVVTGATPTLGFTALVVATVASLAIVGTVVAGLFFGALQAAIVYLPIVSDLPPSGLRIIEGLVALLMTAQLATVMRSRGWLGAGSDPDPGSASGSPSGTAGGDA